jgi:hypothetical protein
LYDAPAGDDIDETMDTSVADTVDRRNPVPRPSHPQAGGLARSEGSSARTNKSSAHYMAVKQQRASQLLEEIYAPLHIADEGTKDIEWERQQEVPAHLFNTNLVRNSVISASSGSSSHLSERTEFTELRISAQQSAASSGNNHSDSSNTSNPVPLSRVVSDG